MTIFKLPELPYAKDALEPHISKETIEYHYGKHHQAYADNLNKLIVGTEFEDAKLEDIIRNSKGGLFNNAAQFYNHNVYWYCFSPTGGGEPKGKLLEKINEKFGSFSEFKDLFTASATSLFGSGWVWLVIKKDGDLEIVQTSNADNPLTKDENILVALDIWEHAYYIDRRNNRGAYIEAFWKIVNWDYVESRLEKACSK